MAAGAPQVQQQFFSFKLFLTCLLSCSYKQTHPETLWGKFTSNASTTVQEIFILQLKGQMLSYK